jgi:hypothetical protein
MQKAACVAAEAKATKSGGPAPKAEETTVQRERVPLVTRASLILRTVRREVGEGLLDFILRVHDKRPAECDRLFQRPAREHEKPDRRGVSPQHEFGRS